MARKLVVEIVGDSKSYERALGRSAQATNQFGTAVGAVNPRIGKLQGTMAATGFSAVGLAGAAGGLAVVLGGKSVQAASDLNEEITKSEQIFGASARAIRDWSETTAEGIGISQTEALRATGTFGALFKTLAFGADQNADLSKTLVQLAADMSSFNNANPTDVLLALRSGLTGETEPLRRFGVFLSEARTQQVALNQTGKETAKQLTNQEKVFARYTIIMKDTASAQGDVARTSGSFANQQRQLSAQVSDLEAKLGAVLLPTLTNLVTTLNEVIGVSGDVFNALGKLRDFGPIDIPITIAAKITFFGGGVGGIKGLIDEAKKKTAEAVEAGLTAGLGPIKSLEDLFEGKGGRGFTLFPSTPGADRRAPGAKPAVAPKAPKQPKPDPKVGNAIIAQITRQAAAQEDLNRQLADSIARAAHLKDLIRADPDNAKLQRRLSDELGKQVTLREQIANAAKAQAAADKAAAKAIQDQLLATFDLAAARAGLTKSLQDDLAAAKAREATLKRLVALNRQDVDLANQLVSATEERRDIERQIADAQKERVKAQQFKALGLTAEGLKPTPGAGSLLKRATGLQQQIKGTVLDTAKNRSQLKTIVNFLKKNFKKAGKDVRAAILDMLNEISGAADKKKGPLTKGHGLNMNKIIEGMGLTPDQERELRGRLGGISAGATRTNAPGTGGKPDRRAGRGGEGFFVESHTTINIDGKRVASVVTNNQQKAKRRNPQQKRGQHRS